MAANEVNVRGGVSNTDSTKHLQVTTTEHSNKTGLDVVTYDVAHAHVHNGEMYQVHLIDLALADGASLNLLIQVGATYTLHFEASLDAGGDSVMYLYEGTTFSAAGTSVTAFNKKRSSSNTTDATLTHTPTITAVGTELNAAVLGAGAGKTAGGGAGGGAVRGGDEWVLAKNTNYLLRLTNISGLAKPVSMTAVYYEATE